MTTPHPVDVAAAYRGSRALVLGGGGFIGRWVARRLTESQATLSVAVRDSAAFERIAGPWGIIADVLTVNLRERASMERVIRQAEPDIVFNLIGYGIDRSESEPALMWEINRDLVRRAALACVQSRPAGPLSGRFVHVGSALEYGMLEGVATEDSDTHPDTLYGQSKLAGTKALRAVAMETGLKAVTARAFTVFGPGEHPGRLLPTIRRAAVSGTTARLSAGSQRRDFCYVADVAEGLLRLGVSTAAPGEAVNLATGRMIPVREFAETAAKVLGLADDALQFGAEPIREDEMRIGGVDISRLKSCTGWAPPSELEALLRKAADFEDHLGRQSFSAEVWE